MGFFSRREKNKDHAERFQEALKKGKRRKMNAIVQEWHDFDDRDPNFYHAFIIIQAIDPACDFDLMCRDYAGTDLNIARGVAKNQELAPWFKITAHQYLEDRAKREGVDLDKQLKPHYDDFEQNLDSYLKRTDDRLEKLEFVEKFKAAYESDDEDLFLEIGKNFVEKYNEGGNFTTPVFGICLCRLLDKSDSPERFLTVMDGIGDTINNFMIVKKNGTSHLNKKELDMWNWCEETFRNEVLDIPINPNATFESLFALSGVDRETTKEFLKK